MSKKKQPIDPDAPPVPDEVAQIVCNGSGTQVILRYRSEKRAEKLFKQLEVTWLKARKGQADSIVLVPGDMFDSLLDLTAFSNITLVVHSVARKFEPVR